MLEDDIAVQPESDDPELISDKGSDPMDLILSDVRPGGGHQNG